MLMKNEAKKAIKRIDNIIQKWEEHWIESSEAVELLVPDLKTIICYLERTREPEEEES